MAERDLDRAASRFAGYLRRIQTGLELQRERAIHRDDSAPVLLPDSPKPVKVFMVDEPDNDLDYYVYELGRLRAVGNSIIKVFDKPSELIEARSRFEAGIPYLLQVRDPLTHPNDDDKLDDVWFFGGINQLLPGGRSIELINPRFAHHDSAMRYLDELQSFIRAYIQAAIANAPPRSLDQQRADRGN